MGEQAVFPGWARPTPHEFRDLSCPALRLGIEQLPATRGLFAVAGRPRGLVLGR